MSSSRSMPATPPTRSRAAPARSGLGAAPAGPGAAIMPLSIVPLAIVPLAMAVLVLSGCNATTAPSSRTDCDALREELRSRNNDGLLDAFDLQELRLNGC